MIFSLIINTIAQKTLAFFVMHPAHDYYEREIAREITIGYGSANRVLRLLTDANMLMRTRRGKMCYYRLNRTNPFVIELKICINVLMLESLIHALEPYTNKIVLFGSTARGEDTEESDIDLFIITSDNDKNRITRIIQSLSRKDTWGKKHIQTVISTPTEALQNNTQDPVFMQEVAKGKIVWERSINEDNF